MPREFGSQQEAFHRKTYIIWPTDVTDACLSIIECGGHQIAGDSMGAKKIHDVERRGV